VAITPTGYEEPRACFNRRLLNESSARQPAASHVMRTSVLVLIGCCLAALVLAAGDTVSAVSVFPNWVFGNHTACSACSHGVPIDVDSSNSKAYSRALQCSSSQVVVIVPGDTPIHTTRPLQMVSRAACARMPVQ
jgi:hypothetical protein